MRIAGKGLIDRGTPVRFRFDGVDYSGFKGDTVASALLACASLPLLTQVPTALWLGVNVIAIAAWQIWGRG